ncbi:MAG: helix-hairpin-helix domain-containing protein [Flavobacteriales bacterium]
MKKPFILFSKRMERGTLIWLCICALIIFIPRIQAYFFEPDLSFEWSYVQEKNTRHTTEPYNTALRASKVRFKRLWKRCPPESLGSLDWQRLGLSVKQASSILRFRDKYGIHSLEQMQRIRVLPADLLTLIADSLVFDQQKTTPLTKSFNEQAKQTSIAKPEKKIQKLDLNAATIEMLVALPGIGQYTAEKIISYRTRLGGFLHVDQLSEIKGIKPEILENTIQYMEINEGVKKLTLNSITYELLIQHPYLSWNQANSIIKMRNQKGGFKELKELKESVLIDEETYNKLLPYVSL